MLLLVSFEIHLLQMPLHRILTVIAINFFTAMVRQRFSDSVFLLLITSKLAFNNNNNTSPTYYLYLDLHFRHVSTCADIDYFVRVRCGRFRENDTLNVTR